MGSSGFSPNGQATAMGIVFQTDIQRARYEKATAANLRRRFAPAINLGKSTTDDGHACVPERVPGRGISERPGSSACRHSRRI
jgi:hypothetical protein